MKLETYEAASLAINQLNRIVINIAKSRSSKRYVARIYSPNNNYLGLETVERNLRLNGQIINIPVLDKFLLIPYDYYHLAKEPEGEGIFFKTLKDNIEDSIGFLIQKLQINNVNYDDFYFYIEEDIVESDELDF